MTVKESEELQEMKNFISHSTQTDDVAKRPNQQEANNKNDEFVSPNKKASNKKKQIATNPVSTSNQFAILRDID